jgi:hypothetical protein
MALPLAEERVQETIQKNTTTSYGLTLVIGLPFPAEISHRIRHIQEQLEILVPGRFTWYGLHHLHATLVAPLRGRYRDVPPLQREELPASLQDFAQDLANFFTQRSPFSLELAGVSITNEGLIVTRENTLVRQMASNLRKYPRLDPSKHSGGLHVTIGFLNTSRPFVTDEEQARFEIALSQLIDIPIGWMIVQQVWLVHYANRTLDRIIGKVRFTLGESNILTVERLLRELNIAVTPMISSKNRLH